MTSDYIDEDAVMLSTRIPEGHRVDGLTYGAHVSRIGWCGYYVHLPGSDRWGVARMTPASNELPEPDEDEDEDETQDEAIVRCIRAELQEGGEA